MRYTENKYDTEVSDLIDLIRLIFFSILLAPFRLLGEISRKIMYLNKQFIEKMVLGIIVIDLAFILWDVLVYIFTGKINPFTGFCPIVVKVAVLVLTGLFSLFALKNLEYSFTVKEVAQTVKKRKHIKLPGGMIYVNQTEADKVEEKIQEEVPEVVKDPFAEILRETESMEEEALEEEEEEEEEVFEEEKDSKDISQPVAVEEDLPETIREIGLEELSQESSSLPIISLEDLGRTEDDREEPTIDLSPDFMLNEISPDILALALSEDTLFSPRPMNDLVPDMSSESILKILESDKSEEDLL